MNLLGIVAVVATILQINGLVQGNSLTITLDTSKAPQLANFASKVQQTLIQWYPFLCAELPSPGYTPPNSIKIIFDPNYNGAAYATGYQIVGGVNYYTNHQDDVGSMIHEITHIIQNYRNCPGWLTEGIADWIRYYRYETNRKPGKPSSSANYQNGYGVTAYFLQYIMNNSLQWVAPSHMVYWANKDCREGTYSDSMWLRMTGKTLDQLWNDMMINGVVTAPALLPTSPTIKYIKNLGSVLCLDTNPNGNVYALTCNDDNYQKWNADGTNFLKNVQTGRCLDSNSNGDVYAFNCNGGDYQKWTRQGTSLQNVKTGRCLDSNGDGKVYTSGYCNVGSFMVWI